MIFNCYVTPCKNCGINIVNSDLCDLCNKGYTKEEVHQIRMEEARKVNEKLLEILLRENKNIDSNIKFGKKDKQRKN